jgi:hypothetical protein
MNGKNYIYFGITTLILSFYLAAGEKKTETKGGNSVTIPVSVMVK